MRILLLGKNGQLGWELHRTLLPLGHIIAMDYPEIDLANPDRVVQVVQEVRPEVIVNATAYTAVDRAETDIEATMAINAHTPGLLAEQASRINAALIHYSTDYVFDGTKGAAYVETDGPNPLNEYGRSKLAGEEAIKQVNGANLTLRTSWVYSLRRDSFVTKILSWSRQHKELRIVIDQVSNPTWARMLAEVSAQLLSIGSESIVGWIGEHRGLYHLAGSGYTSRLEWASAILKYDPAPGEQVVKRIEPAMTEDFPSPAQRPTFSALDCTYFKDTFGVQLPDWEQSLMLAMEL